MRVDEFQVVCVEVDIKSIVIYVLLEGVPCDFQLKGWLDFLRGGGAKIAYVE